MWGLGSVGEVVVVRDLGRRDDANASQCVGRVGERGHEIGQDGPYCQRIVDARDTADTGVE